MTARLALAALPPFDLELTVASHRRAESNVIDRWEDGAYRRALDVGGGPRLVSVTWNGDVEQPTLEITVEGGAASPAEVEQLGETVRQVLGPERDLGPFYAFAAQDPVLGPLTAGALRGLQPPRAPSVFEALVAAFSAQQITLPFAMRLLGRLSEAYGERLEIGGRAYLAFPSPERLAQGREEDLVALQYSRNKARYILGAARAVADGDLDLEGLAALDNATVLGRLRRVPGVGRWTAEYLLMRALGRLDVFPAGDSGLAQAISRFYLGGRKPTPTEIDALVEGWGPWRGYAYFYLARAKRLPVALHTLR